MPTMIFPNLPVRDLERAKSFYTALGWTLNPQFTDENAAAVVVSDEIVVMLLSPGFTTQTGMSVPDGAPSASLAVSTDSRDEVDAIFERAIAAGATPRGETEDMGFMYSRGVTDPDGHYWDFLWMDA